MQAWRSTHARKDPLHPLIYCVSVCQHSTIVILLCVRWGGVYELMTECIWKQVRLTSLTSDDTKFLVARAALSAFPTLIGSTSDKLNVKSCVCLFCGSKTDMICAVIGCSVRVTHNGAMFLRTTGNFQQELFNFILIS